MCRILSLIDNKCHVVYTWPVLLFQVASEPQRQCANVPSFIECVSEGKCGTFAQIHIRTNLCLWLSKLHMCATLMDEQSIENWVWHSCRWNMQRYSIWVATVCCMVCMCVCEKDAIVLPLEVSLRPQRFRGKESFISSVTKCQRYSFSLCLSSLFLSSSLAPTTLRWEIKERDHMDHSGPFDV